MGRPVDEIIGGTLREVMGEPAIEKIRPHIERVLGGGCVWTSANAVIC
jgi:hypothetical protein